MPIDKGLVRWRVARVIHGRVPEIGQLVGYVDTRQVMTMLDDLDLRWSATHTPIIADGNLIGVQADLTVDGVTRSDVGVPSNQDPIKGAFSDALKRAAVHFGVGRELYELPQVYAPLTQVGRSFVPAAKPTFNEDTGRWEIESPGWITYPDEEPPKHEPEGSNITLKIAPPGTGRVVGTDKKDQIKKLARRLELDKAGLLAFANEKRGMTLDLANMDDEDMDTLITALTEEAVVKATGGELE